MVLPSGKNTLLLIDANSLIHRAFHALPPLTSPSGMPAQAIYGVASILLKIWRENPPHYAAALFDRPEPTFRKKMYDAYKAQRPKAPDELVVQIKEARRLFDVFHIPTLELAGFEADDLIATLVTRFKTEPDLFVVILTGDRDTLQLVEGDKVVVQAPRRGVSDTIRYDEEAVCAEFGLPPGALNDYKALVGDPSDNVKGVRGIGPKTAKDLILKYGAIEKLYAAARGDAVLAKKVGPTEQEAVLSKSLVALKSDVPIEKKDLGFFAVRIAKDEIAEYFSTFGFKSLVARLENEGATPAIKKKKPPRPQTLF